MKITEFIEGEEGRNLLAKGEFSQKLNDSLIEISEEAMKRMEKNKPDLAKVIFFQDKDAEGIRESGPWHFTRENVQALISGSLKPFLTDYFKMYLKQLVWCRTEFKQLLRGQVVELIGRQADRNAEAAFEKLGLMHQMRTDPLTKLPNRMAFLERRVYEIERWKRDGPLSMMLLDLDHFKQVNDTYGHPVGDEVLSELAKRITSSMRKSDYAARWGGEEFVILCPDSYPEEACIGAHRVLEAIKSKPFKVGESGKPLSINMSASIGVGAFTKPELDPQGDKMLKEADDNLYVLKGDKDNKGKEKKPDLRGNVAVGQQIISLAEAHRRFKIRYPDGKPQAHPELQRKRLDA